MSDFFHPLTWTTETVQRFWDFAGSQGHEYVSAQVGPALVARMRRHLAGKVVLDYGCGPGYLLPPLAGAAKAVLGIEPSPDSRAIASERIKDHGNVTVAATLDPAQQGTFDAMVSVDVIEHLDDEALAGLFTMAREALRPGGMLIVTTPNDEDLDRSLVGCPSCGAVFHRWQHLRTWTTATLSAALADAGFVPQEIFADDLSYPPGLRGRVMRGLRDALRGAGKPPNLLAVARRAPNQA